MAHRRRSSFWQTPHRQSLVRARHIASRLAPWSIAATPLTLLARSIAIELDSIPIGLIGAGLAGLIATAFLSSVRPGPTGHRR